LIVGPELAEAPVTLSVIVPTVHENVLGVEAAKLIFGPAPLQIENEFGVVTDGVGSTVTMIE
jgi:hypothetical protein